MNAHRDLTSHDETRTVSVRTGRSTGRDVTIRLSALHEAYALKPGEVLLCEDLDTGDALGLMSGTGGWDLDATRPVDATWSAIENSIVRATETSS